MLTGFCLNICEGETRKMKRSVTVFICVCLLLSLCPTAGASYVGKSSDYMLTMINCAIEGDHQGGEAAEGLRNEKIETLGLDYPSVDYTELELLSRLIEAEAGSAWLSREWKMSVGEVVLNRMKSPEFPDTMSEVISQPGQYSCSASHSFTLLRPSLESVIAAKLLLEGERVINDESVVFQSNFILGSGIHTVLYDSRLGYTYLCYSSYPELYAE